MKCREITASDVPALFYVRPRTRENAMTLEELERLGINARNVTESLGQPTKGWVCDDSGEVVGFSMADRATGEFLVVAVLPEHEGKGVGGTLMALAENGSPHRAARARGFRRISIPHFALTASIANGDGPIGSLKETIGTWSSTFPRAADR